MVFASLAQKLANKQRVRSVDSEGFAGLEGIACKMAVLEVGKMGSCEVLLRQNLIKEKPLKKHNP